MKAEEIVETLRAMHGVEHQCTDGGWAPPDLTDPRYDPDPSLPGEPWPLPAWPCPTGRVLGIT